MAESRPDVSTSASRGDRARGVIARGFTLVEDVVYVGLGALLSIGASQRERSALFDCV